MSHGILIMMCNYAGYFSFAGPAADRKVAGDLYHIRIAVRLFPPRNSISAKFFLVGDRFAYRISIGEEPRRLGTDRRSAAVAAH